MINKLKSSLIIPGQNRQESLHNLDIGWSTKGINVMMKSGKDITSMTTNVNSLPGKFGITINFERNGEREFHFDAFRKQSSGCFSFNHTKSAMSAMTNCVGTITEGNDFEYYGTVNDRKYASFSRKFSNEGNRYNVYFNPSFKDPPSLSFDILHQVGARDSSVRKSTVNQTTASLSIMGNKVLATYTHDYPQKTRGEFSKLNFVYEEAQSRESHSAVSVKLSLAFILNCSQSENRLSFKGHFLFTSRLAYL